MPIICAVRYSVRPGSRPAVMTIAEKNVHLTRLEPGNIAYSHFPSMENDTDMFVYEVWESQAAVEAHLHAPHYLEFSELRKPMLTAHSYHFTVYEATEIQSGTSIPTW
ncbi:putative quinol monooxygenase [Tsukamurella conjunctivitidis]|uniref:Antibiotic biosynthesis monooxygenase n=1 Tax=Tsukamurella columbiensis TaxID=128509 RepID=A0ABX1LFV4_9ACTN|nr:antibiotic biosynthesis monooxygenase [Tsukamurella columbiensis]